VLALGKPMLTEENVPRYSSLTSFLRWSAARRWPRKRVRPGAGSPQRQVSPADANPRCWVADGQRGSKNPWEDRADWSLATADGRRETCRRNEASKSSEAVDKTAMCMPAAQAAGGSIGATVTNGKGAATARDATSSECGGEHRGRCRQGASSRGVRITGKPDAVLVSDSLESQLLQAADGSKRGEPHDRQQAATMSAPSVRSKPSRW